MMTGPRRASLGRFLFCLFLAISSSPMARAESACPTTDPAWTPKPFEKSVLPHRSTFGLTTTLRIRPDDQRVLEVLDIPTDGPAHKAGFAEGDLITAIQGSALPAWGNDYDRIVDNDLRYPPNESVSFRVERDGQPLELSLRPEPMKPEAQQRLIRWVDAAEERLGNGLALYCTDEAAIAERNRQAEKRKRSMDAMWAAIAPYPKVKIVFTRQANGELAMKTDPEIELPDDFAVYYLEDHEHLVEALEVGEEFRTTLMNPKYRG